MQVKFKYTSAGKLREGAIDVASAPENQHEIVRAVVQHVANEAGEPIVFSMLNPAGNLEVGTNMIEPEGQKQAQTRTIESIDIAQPDGSWGRLTIVR